MKCILFISLVIIFTGICRESPARIQDSFLVKKVHLKGLSPEAFYSALHQDDDGFLWIGTIGGLYRYDGSKVTRFVRDPSDSNSMTHNYANSLTKDQQGNLWIGTYGGFMNLYNRHLGSIKRIGADIKNQARVTVIKIRMSLNNDNVIVATTYCFYKFHATGFISDSILLPKGPARITDFLEYKPGKFVLTTSMGLYILDWKTRNFKKLPVTANSKNFNCIEKDNAGNLWIGSDRKIIALLPGNFNLLDSSKYAWGIPSNTDIRCIKRDKSGRMWIGTRSGLFMAENGFIQKILAADSSASPVNINDIFIDKKETVWVATADNGLYQVYQPALLFHHIPGMKAYSKQRSIQSILEEKKGVWLIGTATGLFRYYFSSGQFEKIKIGNTDIEMGISYQLKDRQNGYWIATRMNGIFYLPAGSNDYIHFKHEPSNANSIPSNNVTALEEDQYGRLWIGTYNGGSKMNSMCYYDPGKKIIQRILSNASDTAAFNSSNISQIEEDNKHNLWIGSWDDGLYSCRLTGRGTLQHAFIKYSEISAMPHKISHDVVSCVRPGRNGIVWFGTVSGGINELDTKTNGVKWYTINDGLPSNFIYRIEEDEQGIVWISTDNGISRFDPVTKAFMNYNTSAGLPSNNFAFLTSAKCIDGTIVFGTNDGQVVYFNPNSYKNYLNTQPVVITDIRLFNKSIEPGNGSILYKAANITDTIRLNYDQTVISFELSNMDFLNPENYTYAYKLDGFDKNWTYITDRNSVTYTNLDPGTYTLQIKNADHYGIWNETPTQLILIIKPPFWKTWWFISLYVLSAAGLVYVLFRYRLQQKLQVFHIRNRLHRDLHDDVGATLSSVKAYSEILQDNPNNPVIAELIKENSTEMIDRLEVIAWATNPRNDNFRSLKNLMIKFAAPICHSKNIDCPLESEGINEEMLMSGEIRQNIFLVFKEAVNNMVKYADATICSTHIFIRNSKFVMQVKDDGKGFDGTTKGTGNGWKNMQKRTEDLNGKLMIESLPQKGTTITMSLPYPFKIPSSWDS